MTQLKFNHTVRPSEVHYPFENFVSQVEAGREQQLLDLIKQKHLKKTISEKYLQKKQILPISFSNQIKNRVQIGEKNFLKRNTFHIRITGNKKEENKQNFERLSKSITRQGEAPMRKFTTSNKWSIYLTSEEKNTLGLPKQISKPDFRKVYLQQKQYRMERIYTKKIKPSFTSLYRNH